jgi:DNA-binding GntR family transcriptional regulator
MESILKKQAQTVPQRDLMEYSKSDFDFHAILYESCGNWLLKEQLENIKRRSRPFVCDITPVLKPLYQDHKDVVEAFRVKDAAAAKKIMKTHNKRMQDQIELTLKSREDEDGTHI